MLSGAPTRPFTRPRTRERVTGVPNFRDHGMTVDRWLLALVGRLQARHGEAWASEAGLRFMIAQDTQRETGDAHMPGLDTVRRALERLERRGLVLQTWLLPGGVLPDKSTCTHGTRLLTIPRLWRDRRVVRTRNRREGITNRVDGRALHTLEQARAAIAAKVTPAPDARELAAARKRDEDRLRLAELAAKWERPTHEKPPPE